MVSKAAWTYRGGAGAIGSGAQQDPDTVQPSCLTGQEEGSLSPRRRRIHSSSCSQQHLHTAGDKDNQGTEKKCIGLSHMCLYQCTCEQMPKS